MSDCIDLKGRELPRYVETSPRLNLRLMTEEDSRRIVDWRNEPRVMQNYIYRKPFTLEGQLQYFREKIATGEVIQFIAEEPSGRPVGCTVLNDFCVKEGHGEYGMFIGEPDAAGKGYSPLMVKMTLDFAYDVLGLSRIVCRIFTDNVPSWKGCERGGFRIAGTLPDVECTDGTRKDMYLLEARKEKRVISL